MPETLTQLSIEGVTTVYVSGFLLTVAAWAIGMKIGVVISVIRKL